MDFGSIMVNGYNLPHKQVAPVCSMMRLHTYFAFKDHDSHIASLIYTTLVVNPLDVLYSCAIWITHVHHDVFHPFL